MASDSEIRRRGVFISHTHADRAIADSLNTAFESLFGSGTLRVYYSTKKQGEGAIRAGENWFLWITDRVRESHVALVVLTPASVQKPWVLWEAGAVAGVALADGAGDARRVRPLLYGLRSGDLPSPLRDSQIQLTAGDNRDDAEKLFSELLVDFRPLLSDTSLIRAGAQLGRIVDSYLAAVRKALRTAPMLPTEAAVQEWCLRLDAVGAERRMSETKHVHQWLNVAFGREAGDEPRPLDLRLHRRLGELYLAAREYERASREFELAGRLAPRDIFVLRALGQARLGARDLEATEAVIRQIEGLDPEAFARNVECAALKGRWLREHDPPRLREAHDVYEQALRNVRSYYLGDLLGQAKLALGDREGAKQVYAATFELVEALDEQNVWTHATAATAAVVAGRREAALAHLRAIRDFGPTQENVQSIERGLESLGESLGVPAAELDGLRSALRGE